MFGYDFFGEIPYGVELGKIEVQTNAKAKIQLGRRSVTLNPGPEWQKVD